MYFLISEYTTVSSTNYQKGLWYRNSFQKALCKLLKIYTDILLRIVNLIYKKEIVLLGIKIIIIFNLKAIKVNTG